MIRSKINYMDKLFLLPIYIITEDVPEEAKHIYKEMDKILKNAKEENIKEFIDKNWFSLLIYYSRLSSSISDKFKNNIIEYSVEDIIQNTRETLYERIKDEEYYDLIESIIKLNYWSLKIVKEFGYNKYIDGILKAVNIDSVKNIVYGITIILLKKYGIKVDKYIIEEISNSIDNFVEDLIDVFYEVKEEYINRLNNIVFA